MQLDDIFAFLCIFIDPSINVTLVLKVFADATIV